MALNGYDLRCGKRSGGIRTIALAAVNDIAGVEYEGDKAAGITLASGAAFAAYHFKEDEALYTEQVSYPDGALVVTHTVWNSHWREWMRIRVARYANWPKIHRRVSSPLSPRRTTSAIWSG